VIEKIIGAVKSEQARMAQSALQAPSARDGFEYGRVCGMYAGLQRSLDIIDETLKDRNERERDL
jgi:hypothetical protein